MSLINHAELSNMLIGAYVGELMDIHTKNESSVSSIQYPTVVDNSALTFAVTRPFDSSLVKSLFPDSRTYLSEFQNTHINMSELVKTVIDRDQLNHFLKGIAASDALDIYGMLINLGSDKRLNPLHPFVAQAITTGAIKLPETFEVIIYPMRKEKKITQKGLEENVTAVVHLLNFINQNGQTAQEVIKVRNSIYSDTNNLLKASNPLDFVVEFQSEQSVRMQNVLIPVQFAAEGVVTPYYGIIESQYNRDDYSSHQLSPMFSGNIQSTSLENGSTCTGDLSSSRYGNLHVLNGFNMSSAYFKDTVSNSSLYWIKACQLVSIELLCTEPENVEETQEKE